jgi:hypothetical protein
MCFIQKKFTFYQNSKECFKETLGGRAQGRRGWRDFTRKFLLSSKC